MKFELDQGAIALLLNAGSEKYVTQDCFGFPEKFKNFFEYAGRPNTLKDRSLLSLLKTPTSDGPELVGKVATLTPPEDGGPPQSLQALTR